MFYKPIFIKIIQPFIFHPLQILEDPLSEGIKSTLIIRESRQDHFGIYNCTVVNSYGSDILEIMLKSQSKLCNNPYFVKCWIKWLLLILIIFCS